ncbi:ABC1 kinase family protein [Maribacter sp.]|uniref:ABC1 kinase family protein n=1 Tax=Maribacter sp. TaxID=1897614 RepID=UPI0025C0363E|nr:AarF/ABC1/UbiB kinase family protein [Maribacter sp.]
MAILRIPTQKEIKRYATLFNILVKYGFEDVLSHSPILKFIPNKYLEEHPETKINLSFTKYERIRMVLEELGPTYIKLGQIFSTREDLLPLELIEELEKLQDHVPKLKDFDVLNTVEEELGIDKFGYFATIELEPLAAASLAQVHRAQLINGEAVILKIQRPHITEVIEADLMVMKQVADSLEKYSSQAKAFQPIRIIESFERSIKEELQFAREIGNTERFAKNFVGNAFIHVPDIYKELSTDKIICMELIDGIKVSNIEALKAANINPKAVAKIGVVFYIEQILDHGFFHADPHPGNIFIIPKTEKYVF